VILSTIPPRSGRLEQAGTFAEAVRRISREKKIPLVDYFAEVLKRRPHDWDGSLPRFKNVPGDVYQVPTLISRDGVHPSNPKQYRDFCDESLRSNGFALRNYLSLLSYAEVVRHVLQAPSLDETLTWLHNLPAMAGIVNKGLDPLRFKKLTRDDLKTLKEVQIGGHLVDSKGKTLPDHEHLPDAS
jgi:hypothetical protein